MIWSVILYLWIRMNDTQRFLSARVFFQSLGGGAFSRPLWARFRLCVWAAVENAAWSHGFAFIPGLHSADTGGWISMWGLWTSADVGQASQIAQQMNTVDSHWFNSDECFAIICWRDVKKYVRRLFFMLRFKRHIFLIIIRNICFQNLLQRTRLILERISTSLSISSWFVMWALPQEKYSYSKEVLPYRIIDWLFFFFFFGKNTLFNTHAQALWCAESWQLLFMHWKVM